MATFVIQLIQSTSTVFCCWRIQTCAVNKFSECRIMNSWSSVKTSSTSDRVVCPAGSTTISWPTCSTIGWPNSTGTVTACSTGGDSSWIGCNNSLDTGTSTTCWSIVGSSSVAWNDLSGIRTSSCSTIVCSSGVAWNDLSCTGRSTSSSAIVDSSRNYLSGLVTSCSTSSDSVDCLWYFSRGGSIFTFSILLIIGNLRTVSIFTTTFSLSSIKDVPQYY